ncbi:hypothetical protein WOLCODRAFT_75150 [Wolfiporia cocos MD-104 SS10]|uniref:Uncharacterized protein n=1 Tax=Wolfiporia cocos (strain MD-104) TaxID=742152 RepID=A0A2H3JN33_WOLCO|nr:hypothetical protein WOLCODRAFT_75150 [Wolfiporia cocos MD-104 SS10]
MDISALWDANATRWLEGQWSLLWPAPPSVAKYAFLFNRYLVLGILIAIAYEFCGFNGDVLTDTMVFEAFVLVSTSLNALDRPTAAETPIVKALLSDGIGYFLAVTCLRGANVALASISRPSFTMIGVFFIWSMTTTVLNRSLLQFRRAEDQRWPDEIPLAIRAASPFALGDPREVEMNISTSVLVYEDDIDELDELWTMRLEEKRRYVRRKGCQNGASSVVL